MPRDLLYQEPPPPGLVRGKIANTPGSSSAQLWVTIDNVKWGPVVWTPHGTTLPQKGADCLVGFDDAGVPWLLSFVGPWT